MANKRFIVFANSIKKGGRCVAGREIVSREPRLGSWVRPISDEPEGELLSRHMKTESGAAVQVLDIVEVPFGKHAGDNAHPEDWLVEQGPWKQLKRCARKHLAEFEERPTTLWAESGNRTDRVSGEYLQKQRNHQSLYLIRPEDFRVELTNDHNHFEGCNQKKRRACFRYGRHSYALGLTDPVFNDRYGKKFPAPNDPAMVVRPPHGDNCLLCVSLTPRYEKTGYHYKVVATVLELE